MDERRFRHKKGRNPDQLLDNIEASRKRLDESYQTRVKVLADREVELKEELKAIAPAKKEKATA